MTPFTSNGLVFDQVYSDRVAGSLYKNAAAGPNLPRLMTVKHQDTTDSKSKKASTRSVLRYDRTIELADGTYGVVSGYLVVSAPKDINVTAAIIRDAVAFVKNVRMAGETQIENFSVLGEDVFVNRVQ